MRILSLLLLLATFAAASAGGLTNVNLRPVSRIEAGANDEHAPHQLLIAACSKTKELVANVRRMPIESINNIVNAISYTNVSFFKRSPATPASTQVLSMQGQGGKGNPTVPGPALIKPIKGELKKVMKQPHLLKLSNFSLPEALSNPFQRRAQGQISNSNNNSKADQQHSGSMIQQQVKQQKEKGNINTATTTATKSEQKRESTINNNDMNHARNGFLQWWDRKTEGRSGLLIHLVPPLYYQWKMITTITAPFFFSRLSQYIHPFTVTNSFLLSLPEGPRLLQLGLLSTAGTTTQHTHTHTHTHT